MLTSKALIDSYINHNEFISVKKVLRIIYWDERRNQKFLKCCGICYIKTMETYCVSCKKNTRKKLVSEELNKLD